MNRVRAALLAALLGAAVQASAQPAQRPGAPALRDAVAVYRAGDLAAAEAAFRKLAPSNADAEAWLGALLIERGKGRDGMQALQHALAAGSTEAAQQLALVYAQGLAGTPRDMTRAVQLFEKAADAGNQRAQLNLGILYFRGQGVPRDLVQARAWLEKAAAEDDPYALYALARSVEESDGSAIADPIRATDLYRRAAEKGHPLAALRYGLALADGTGIKQNVLAAQRWLLIAQKDDVPEAALALGDMTARTPPSRDTASRETILQNAAAWYAVAANAGVASAQFKLGNAYYAGAGVTRDVSQAANWYTRAARQGLPEAQQLLSVLLLGGLGGPADPVEGYKWLLLAEKAGTPGAREAREKEAAKLPEADRKRAESLAAAFTPTSERPPGETPPRLVPPPPP